MCKSKACLLLGIPELGHDEHQPDNRLRVRRLARHSRGDVDDDIAWLLIKSEIPREHSASCVLPIVEFASDATTSCFLLLHGVDMYQDLLRCIAICLQLDHRRKRRVVWFVSPPLSYSVGGLVEHRPVEGYPPATSPGLCSGLRQRYP